MSTVLAPFGPNSVGTAGAPFSLADKGQDSGAESAESAQPCQAATKPQPERPPKFHRHYEAMPLRGRSPGVSVSTLYYFAPSFRSTCWAMLGHAGRMLADPPSLFEPSAEPAEEIWQGRTVE
jgi:hypothetical protein